METTIEERWGGAAGLVAFVAGSIGGALERGWPSGHDPAVVATFVEAHRGAILGQSIAFLVSSALFFWFLTAVRSIVSRAEGGSGAQSTIVLGAGVAWITMSMVAQALQIGVGMTHGEVASASLWMLAAVFGVTNLPLAVTVSACAVAAFRTAALPQWWGVLSAVAAFAQLGLFAGTVIDSGPLAPNGWLTYVLYPAFALWVLPTAVMLLRRRAGTPAPSTGEPHVAPAAE